LDELKSILTTAIGDYSWNDNLTFPYNGGIAATASTTDTANNAATFNANITNFLTRENNKPIISYLGPNIQPANHTGSSVGNTGSNGLANHDDVLALLIDPSTGVTYVDLATLCTGLTGRD